MRKAITKISTGIIVIALCLTMLLTFTADAFGGSSAAGYIKQLGSVDTNYKDFVDSSVMFQLPKTVKDDDVISVIVMLDDPALLDTYNKESELSFTEYAFSDEAQALREKVRVKKDAVLERLDELGIKYDTGAEYSTVLTGYEVLLEARYFDEICGVLPKGATAVLGEVYKPAETQLVENKVNVYDTGIFDSSAFGYDGEGMVIAVLDTGLDYTHDAFRAENLAGKKLGLTLSEVEAALGGTNAKEIIPGLLASDVYVSDKVPFAFDYADYDSDVYSIHNNHGTHVSGVIVGDDDVITGVAPKAQVVSMKIFSDTYDSARSSWILSALEDAVTIGVDVINMSIGTSCGFSRVSDEEAISGVYDRIREKGISLVVAASNSYSSTYGSEKNGNLGLTSNPDTGTVGSPSTYESAMSIASINGTKTPYILFGSTIIYFNEATDSAQKEKSFFNELLPDGVDSMELEYVLIPGVGRLADYTDMGVEGKIALVRRGDTTFEQKANAAKNAGAAGLIIYNNTSGEIRMNAGITDIPLCSISQDDGEMLASQKSGKIKVSRGQASGPFMSDFSSWGPTPDLRIKPEITAHGGNILSAITGNQYDRLSGTSMACPNMAGVIALLRQYVMAEYPAEEITLPGGEFNYPEINAIINRLLMSTADIIYNKNGLPYAVRKQGAGLANLTASGASTAYILTYEKGETVFSRDTAMNKTKIELGDDPARVGSYTLTFSVYNFGTVALSYNISALVMTEGVSDTPTYKGDTVVTEEGYLLNGASLSIDKVSGGNISGNQLTVSAGATADVTVTIKLSDEDKSYLDRSFENGMYVEGFIKLEAVSGTEISLNAPFLAFYGDWQEAPLFDLDYFETSKDELNDSIALLDKTLPDAYASRPIGGVEDDYINYLGSYYFIQKPGDKIISASREYVALSNYKGTVHQLRFVWAGLLRNAEKIVITITDDATGEVILTKTENDVRKSYGDGGSIYPANVEIEFDTSEYNLKNNSQYTVKLVGYLDYGNGGLEANENSTFEFPFTTDFEAPAITGVEYYTEYDRDAKKNRLFATVAVYDNHYSMCMQVGYITKAPENSGYENQLITFSDYMTPIYSTRNSTTYVTYELTDYIYEIKNGSVNKNNLAISVYDYAMNIGVYEIPLPDEYIDFYVEETELTLNPYELYTINPLVYPDTAWPELLWYTSSNEKVAKVVNNKIVAVGSGKAAIFVSDDPTQPTKTLRINVTVRKEGDDGYRKVTPQVADVFEVIGYDTIKAYYMLATEDQDIGETGQTHSFDGALSLKMFPSESVKLRLRLFEYFSDLTEISFISGNDKIVSVDKDGVIVANTEGYANITVRVKVNNSTVAKTVRIEVKDPYIRTGPILNNYFGNGGLVEIPKDKMFTEIGQYAFANYQYIQKDPDEITEEEPDFTKIWYVGEDTITKVVIPEGVEKIGPYAFAMLTALEEVVLPSTLKYIEYGAFYGCENLEKVVGIENVVTINKYAFQGCDLRGRISLDSAHAIADYAFAENAKLEGVVISETLRSIGAYAFAGNTGMKSVTINAEKIKLGAYAFMGCRSLDTIEINASVIPAGAFYNCSSLEKVTLGKDVEAFGEYALSGTRATVEIDKNNAYLYSSEDGKAILKKEGDLVKLVLVAPSARGVFTLEGVQIIGEGAFAGNTRITGVVMPDAEHVLDYAFADCTALSSVTLSTDGVKTIETYSFFNTPITKLPTFSAELDEIGAYAFAYTDLTDVVIPEGMTVGEGAFCECQKLRSVTVGKNAVLGMGAFMLGRETTHPRTGLQNWTFESEKNAEGKDIYFHKYHSALISLKIGEGAVIGDSAFLGAASLIYVELGDGVIIGSKAFYNNVSLKDIDLSGVTSIGEMAFSGDVLYQYTDPYQQSFYYDDETSDYVFRFYSPVFEKVELNSLTEIGKNAFQYCNNLKTVVLGNNLTAVADYAFADCEMLSLINLENVKTIGEGAFSYTELSSVNLSSATEIGGYSFLYCDKLTEVTLNTDGSVIGEGAFAYCDKLAKADNLNKVTEIDSYAFAYTALVDLDLFGAVSIGDLAFMKPSPSDHLFVGPELPSVTVKLSSAIRELGDNPFANSKLTPFSSTVTGSWNGKDYVNVTYNYDISDTVKVIDGSLYCKVPYGLELITYVSMGKTADIPEGVVRISAMAFSSSDVVRVSLPHSLNSIGHKAFFDCENLTTVVFKSFKAPVLEEEFDQNYFFSGENFPDLSEYMAGDETYQGLGIVPYIMYLTLDSTTETYDYSAVYYGASFVNYVGHGSPELVMIAPSNGLYYDSFIFDQYFQTRVEGTVAADEKTVAAIDAINALPNPVMLSDEALVIAARAAYDKVVLEQKALVYNYSLLQTAETRIAAFKNTAQTPETPDDNTGDNTAPKKDGGKVALTVVVIIESVIIFLGALGAVYYFLFFKKGIVNPFAKNKKANEENEAQDEREDQANDE